MIEKNLENYRKKFYRTGMDKRELDDGLVLTHDVPHIAALEHLKTTHILPQTANYYLVTKIVDFPADHERIVERIMECQDRDPSSETYGNIKWYPEEDKIHDTNGVFFIMKPLVLAMILCSEKMSEKEKELIKEGIFHAIKCFSHSCKTGGYFYPNKVVSDGSLLLALAKFNGDAELLKEAEDFWKGWLDYTDEYGWGWGENTSKNYLHVIFDALNMVLMSTDSDSEIYKRVYEKRAIARDYMAYHGEYEFVPSIRTYNYNGDTKTYNGQSIISDIIEDGAPAYTPVPDPAPFHKEKIFGRSNAYTWKGENIRLGTIDRFPVMCGCYENQGWGIGWQSMPVSVLALKHEVSYLRFATRSRGELKTHMSEFWGNKNLFPDENIADYYTYSNQVNNAAVIIRMVEHVANTSSYFADEWLFCKFEGEIKRHGDWYLFDYSDCVLAIRAVGKKAELIEEGNRKRLVQKYYEGDEKLLVIRRDVTAWAAMAFDGNDIPSIEKQLDAADAKRVDIYDPRYARIMDPFVISCADARLEFDPDKTDLI